KHRVFVPPSSIRFMETDEPQVHFDRERTHHIRNVLRLGEGTTITVFDNSGQEYECELVECKPSHAKGKVSRATSPRVESSIKVVLAQALIKGNSFERALTLCTELGCNRFVPLFTSRTVVKLRKDNESERAKRWDKIVEQAASQSGRVRVPVVEQVMEFKHFLEKKHAGKKIILWERGGSGQLRQILASDEEPADTVVLLAGPEGGFEQAEVKQAVDAGFQIWGLGPRTLRAETTGAIAVSILQYVKGDMG
ncbi:MAG: 16S rRNA (uracil(1498)-N(3))-methyltransferase, partial [bacterium]